MNAVQRQQKGYFAVFNNGFDPYDLLITLQSEHQEHGRRLALIATQLQNHARLLEHISQHLKLLSDALQEADKIFRQNRQELDHLTARIVELENNARK